MEFSPSLRLKGFADTPVQGEINNDMRFSGYIEASLAVDNIWQGGSMKAQLEYADGDGAIALGKAGVTWPTNTYSAMPRMVNSNQAEWSLWLTHKFNDSHSLSLGKWNVFALAEQTPLVGGQGNGGFAYLGINTPISFVFPPYFLGAQYAYYERYELAGNPTYRPWLEKMCEHLDCNLPPRRDTAAFELRERDVRYHPDYAGALLISGTFINSADFDQPYPTVEVMLKDVNGRIVASRRFAPTEYLHNNEAPSALLKSGTEARLLLEVSDPGNQAVSFEFNFM